MQRVEILWMTRALGERGGGGWGLGGGGRGGGEGGGGGGGGGVRRTEGRRVREGCGGVVDVVQAEW